MSDMDIRSGSSELTFDEVVTDRTSSAPRGTLAVTCAACRVAIESEYYDVNASQVCGRCRTAIESATSTPPGLLPLVRAGAFGLGAGVVGAAIYYAVIAITHLEIGLVAILIGYMVWYAVRRGARGRGGFRFQVLAIALTYAAVALAYTPLAIKGLIDASPQKAGAVAAGRSVSVTTPDSSGGVTTEPRRGSLLLALALMFAFVAALPVMMVLGSLPSGLISALIIFIGMRQAWGMTAAPVIQIFGPYRVGDALPSPRP